MSVHGWIHVINLGAFYMFIYFKIPFIACRPRKWSRDVGLYPKMYAPPSLAWSCHREAAAQAGTTFPSTPSIQMAMGLILAHQHGERCVFHFLLLVLPSGWDFSISSFSLPGGSQERKLLGFSTATDKRIQDPWIRTWKTATCQAERTGKKLLLCESV